ncbi:MAG: hypothetical protein HRU28_03200 [Rhizobiales bacterium]|nr:hypothetical protein [Hyphomicrobiales bacterium]
MAFGAELNFVAGTDVMSDTAAKMQTTVDDMNVAKAAMLAEKDAFINAGIATFMNKTPVIIGAGGVGDVNEFHDLNTYRTPGIYHQNANVNCTVENNYPSKWAGVLIVEVSSAGYVYHTYSPRYTSQKIYRTSGGGGVFDVWQKIIQGQDLAASLPNLLPNSGRFCKDTADYFYLADEATDFLASNMSVYNGATVAQHSQFVHGADIATNDSENKKQETLDLQAKIGRTQHGIEFNILEVTAGAGTTSPYGNGYRAFMLTSSSIQVPEHITLIWYLKMVDGNSQMASSNLVFDDDVFSDPNRILTPADGWVLCKQEFSYPNNYGAGFSHYLEPGKKALIALPSLLSGHHANLPANTGMIISQK